jgi:hypothetical protein
LELFIFQGKIHSFTKELKRLGLIKLLISIIFGMSTNVVQFLLFFAKESPITVPTFFSFFFLERILNSGSRIFIFIFKNLLVQF